ncbi:MAG: ATP-dependent 6-phosphofructokinase [Pseudomonadota bacterium]
MTKRIGILTGGGDCPGLNAVIRAIVRKGMLLGYEMVGVMEGWRGMLDKKTVVLTRNMISGILQKGGTILKTTRTNPYNTEDGPKLVAKNFHEMGFHALIAIGGEDTLGVASKLYEQEKLNVVGVPKTIDNDLSGTDQTFGFDTAITVATDAIDRLHTTAESHQRVLVCEVMGRHAGWIAAYAGLAGGADYILIPEVPVDVNKLCESIAKRHNLGKDFSIIVVSEGAKLSDETLGENGLVLQHGKKDAFGHVILGGIGKTMSDIIQEKTGYETRYTILGHIQRGGSPTAYDRVLGTRYGIHAMELVHSGQFGKMSALRGNDIVGVDLAKATERLKTVPVEFFRDNIEIFFE